MPSPIVPTITEEQLQELVRQLVEERMADLRRELVEQELGRPEPGWTGARRIWEAIQALAEAQRRTEDAVHALAEAQRRTEEEVHALAEAQRRTEERLTRVEERLDRLEKIVQELIEAQRRTEERLQRLEETVQALAEAQRRTEERLQRLEETVQALAEAQRRTEERLNVLAEALAELTRRVDQMGQQLGQLANRVGLDIETDAEEVLRALVDEKGLRMLQDPIAIAVDGEIDLAVPVETSAGERFWILVEVKGRLRRSELGDWLHQLRQPGYQERLRRAGVEKPYLPYAFGMRLYLGVEEMAREAGVGILTFRGERVPPRLWE